MKSLFPIILLMALLVGGLLMVAHLSSKARLNDSMPLDVSEFEPLNEPQEFVDEPDSTSFYGAWIETSYEGCIEFYRELLALATSSPYGVKILLPPGNLCEEYKELPHERP